MKQSHLTPASISFDKLHAWHGCLAEAFAQVGAADFIRYLARALSALVPVESMMISLECQGRSPQLLYEQGIPDEHRESIINRYFARGYMLDPFCLAVASGLAQGFYTLAEIAPDNFFSSEYYKIYCRMTGCGAECYYIVDLGDSSKISVCLYQGLSSRDLTSTELGLLSTAEPMVRALIGQFARDGLKLVEAIKMPLELANPAQESLDLQLQAAFIRFGGEILTEREREVAHLVLRGHSVKSTAKMMEISPETVRMHRKNLYSKLQISTQAELFALFIEGLTQCSSSQALK